MVTFVDVSPVRFFYFYFVILHWCQNVFDYDHYYLMVHVFFTLSTNSCCGDKTIYIIHYLP